MTLMGAINHIDAIKPNAYSQTEKIKWISTLDGMIKKEIIDTHEGGEKIEFNGYQAGDLGKDLLVPSPYDDVYIKWLEVQIDYANGEYGKYNNSIMMFTSAYSTYEKYYNRTHMPKQVASFKNW